ALEGIVKVFAMRRGAVDQRGAGSAERARMADRRTWAVIVAGGKRCLNVVLVARRRAQPDHVHAEGDALLAHALRKGERGDAFRQVLGQRDIRELAHPRILVAPKPGMRLIAATTAKVMTSMMMPRTAMAPRSPDSLRSKISTEMTFVSEVNRMIAAESSRITPTKMKHQVAITLVRNSGAVMWPSACRRVAPRMRLASSRSGLMVRNADCSC